MPPEFALPDNSLSDEEKAPRLSFEVHDTAPRLPAGAERSGPSLEDVRDLVTCSELIALGTAAHLPSGGKSNNNSWNGSAGGGTTTSVSYY